MKKDIFASAKKTASPDSPAATTMHLEGHAGKSALIRASRTSQARLFATFGVVNRKANRAHPQCGASLLEGIAYLGIAALVILGAISLLTSAFSGAQTNQLTSEVTAIRTAVKKLYMSQSGGFGTASMVADLVSSKVLPASLAFDGEKLTNPWNGTITITGATSQFTITYPNVPQDVCINTLTNSSGWASVKVNASAAITTLPATPSDANTKCDSATNTIVWTSN